jgi:colicin import membrane protein
MGPQAQQNGFLLSATLHGSVVALALLWSFAVSLNTKPPSRILELVQGEGNNYGATVAPALGTPGGVKLTVPAPLTPKPEVAKPEPAPITPAEPQPTPQPKAPPVTKQSPAPVTPAPPTKAADTTPNFAKSIRRKLIAADSRAKAAVAKERAAEAKAAAAAAKVQHIDTEGIVKGVVGGSTANKEGGAGGKALESLNADFDSRLIAALRIALEKEKPPGLSDALIATVVFNIGADGSLTNIRITKRSGSAEFDAAVRAAFRRVGSVGPRPDRKSESDVELDFRAKEQDGG